MGRPIVVVCRTLVVVCSCIALLPTGLADEIPPDIAEGRDTAFQIEGVDSVRVLSTSKAREFEQQVTRIYDRFSAAVVRVGTRDDQGAAADPAGVQQAGEFSGVIIDPDGLILTCAHHDLEAGTAVTIELSSGKRVPGKMLGRFKLNDPPPLHVGTDLGLARITEAGPWPFASLAAEKLPVDGQPCLAIGYPGTLAPGRAPYLRTGRVAPAFPGRPCLETTTAIISGDSGGPLFDLNGNVIGIACGCDGVAPARYQPVTRLSEFRDRLEAGEIVSAPTRAIRALRGRPHRPSSFLPALDLEDRILQVQRSVIRFMDGPHEVAAGLVVDADGWAITKASLIGTREEWTCRVFYVADSGALVKGRVIAKSPEHDLALLKLDVRDWRVAPWGDARPKIGTFVTSVLGRSHGPVEFSVVGAASQSEPAQPNGIPQLFVQAGPDSTGAAIVMGAGPETAEFDAFRGLLRAGDVIRHVNGTPTPTSTDYGRASDRLIYALQPGTDEIDYSQAAPGAFHGDWVSIGIRRGYEERTVLLPKVHSAHVGALEWYSNPLSLRRESFETVFAHDGAVRPEECGGPVVDLAGCVIGLNIARADEVRTLAIPADVLQKVIADLRQQAKAEGN